MRACRLDLKCLFIVLIAWSLGCQKESNAPLVDPFQSQVSSPQFQNELLFVDTSNFQIQTTEPATFSSPDSLISISEAGLIERITSGAVVPIDISWTNSPGSISRIYALGATDDQHDEPYASWHGRIATDPDSSYRLGWQTLQKLPVGNETYGIILRHADANVGADNAQGPANWWTSCDPAIARQLSDVGKQNATELGVILKDLGLPIARVISSEFCRAKTTAELVNAGPAIVTDGRLNHPEYNRSGKSLFKNMIEIMQEQPVDNQTTLLVTHHPINETGTAGYPTFPGISPFTWTGVYFVKVGPDKTITYQGAASLPMLRHWANKKLNRLAIAQK